MSLEIPNVIIEYLAYTLRRLKKIINLIKNKKVKYLILRNWVISYLNLPPRSMKLPSFRQERLIGKSPWAVHWRTAVPPRRTSSFFERTLKWTGAGKEKDHVYYLSSVAVHKLDYSRWIIPYRFWGQFFNFSLLWNIILKGVQTYEFWIEIYKT